MTTEEYGGSSPAFHTMTDAYNGALNSRTQNMKVRRVNKTTLGMFTVSTLRLPRDMDDFHHGKVYETMIWYNEFGSDKEMNPKYHFTERPVDTWMNYQERCRTYSEAVQQHKDAVMYIELFVNYDEPDEETCQCGNKKPEGDKLCLHCWCEEHNMSCTCGCESK